MTKKENLSFRRGDFLAIALVILLAVLVAVLYLPGKSGDPLTAEVYQDGQLLKRVSLQTDITFEVTGKYTNVITVEDGTVAITAADCPGEDCVHSGAIRTPGRSLVCLPNGVEVRIVGQSGDVDFVVG